MSEYGQAQQYVLGLGSNMGSSHALFALLPEVLQSRADVRVLACSSLYRTAPLGPAQADFLNAALRIETPLAPRPLLDRLQGIEARFGRRRLERWGPRTLDLDLLWWSAGEFDAADLRIPHPGLLERSFALSPLLEVLPEADASWRVRAAALGQEGVRRRQPWWAPSLEAFRQGERQGLVSCALDPLSALARVASALVAEAGASVAPEGSEVRLLRAPIEPREALHTLHQALGASPDFRAVRLVVEPGEEGFLTFRLWGERVEGEGAPLMAEPVLQDLDCQVSLGDDDLVRLRASWRGGPISIPTSADFSRVDDQKS